MLKDRSGCKWRLGAAATLVALATLATAAPASADSSCPTGYACVWTDTNYNGAKKTIPSSQAGNGWIDLTGQFNNNIASLKNRYTNKFFFLAPYVNGGGGWVAWDPGDSCPDLDIASSPCNGFQRNTASSFRVE